MNRLIWIVMWSCATLALSPMASGFNGTVEPDAEIAILRTQNAILKKDFDGLRELMTSDFSFGGDGAYADTADNAISIWKHSPDDMPDLSEIIDSGCARVAKDRIACGGDHIQRAEGDCIEEGTDEVIPCPAEVAPIANFARVEGEWLFSEYIIGLVGD